MAAARRRLRILVTAGGTREPIDAVRVIANTSTGALGRALCIAARVRGHRVLLLAPADLPRLAGPLPDGVEHRPFVSTADLQRELKRAAAAKWDAVIHAAAVSDYRPAKVARSKMPSTAKALVLHLVRTPKLIARLRRWFGKAALVGFKLTSGATPAERIRLARAQLRANRTDLCVANDAREITAGFHPALLVAADRILAVSGTKAALARAILRNVER